LTPGRDLLDGWLAARPDHRNLSITAVPRFRFASRKSLATDPEFRAALAGYLEWDTRLAMHNSQPGADVAQQAPVPGWD
jgi:hemoglobin